VGAWLKAGDPGLQAAPAWNDPALDDTSWNSHELIGTWRIWDVPELKTFDGIMWLRKTVELTEAEAQGAASLALGPIDSTDMAWINGTEIGAGFGYDVSRVYPVPAGVLHAGKNVIAIAVQSGAGILNPSDKLTLTFANGNKKPLTGPWRWKTSVTSDKIGHAPYQPWLNQFGVSTLYNGMIVSLGPTAISGIVWYQGETDAWQPKEYGRLLTSLIEDWRGKFGATTPFYVVQLPNYGPTTVKPVHSDWALLRETQRKIVDATPGAGLAVAIDLGSPDNIHPQAKQEVGRRVGLLARKFVYGQDIVAQSPAPLAVKHSGKNLIIHFDHAGKGLETRGWDRPIGFSLCDAVDKCSFVDGVVSKDSVTLDAARHPKAIAVRFCWADSPLCNLVNSAGLPTVPFELPLASPKKRLAKQP
jgi:sialate O-acetylesterase